MWFITQEDKKNYIKMFRTFDKNNSNTLSAQEMQEVMLMTKLDTKVCGKVWELSNPSYQPEFT